MVVTGSREYPRAQGILMSNRLAFKIGTSLVGNLADYVAARGGTVLSPPDAPILRFRCGAKSDLSTLLRTLGYKVVEVGIGDTSGVFDIKLSRGGGDTKTHLAHSLMDEPVDK
jgi:hypothetical protein